MQKKFYLFNFSLIFMSILKQDKGISKKHLPFFLFDAPVD